MGSETRDFIRFVVAMVIVSQVHQIWLKTIGKDLRKECTDISSSVMISALFLFLSLVMSTIEILVKDIVRSMEMRSMINGDP